MLTLPPFSLSTDDTTNTALQNLHANDALTGVVVFQLTPTHTHQFMHSSLLIKLTNYRHLNQYFLTFYLLCYIQFATDGLVLKVIYV
jgi:hypothetical protein